MLYNILINSQYSTNTTLGNKSLTLTELTNIISYTETSPVSLAAGDILVIDIDLGSRLATSALDYKFETAVASTVVFSYKNELFETNYTSLSTTHLGSIFSATIPSFPFAPRYLRIIHTLNTDTGNLLGLRALNDDSIVNFGSNGTLTTDTSDVVRDNSVTIKPIPIFNSGATKANAYLSLDPTRTIADEIIAVGTTENGPWSYPLSKDVVIADKDIFSYGTLDNLTLTTNNNLEVSYLLDNSGNKVYTQLYGRYWSKILTSSELAQMALNVTTYTTNVGKIAVDDTDTVPTIEVRSSNEKPMSYSFYRYLVFSGRNAYLRTKWLYNNLVISDVGPISDNPYASLVNYETVVAKTTDRSIGWYITYSTSGSSFIRFMLYNVIGSTYYTYKLCEHNTNSYYINANVVNIKLTNSGRTWIYFFSESYNTTDFINKSGYYLACFTSTLTNTFKWYDAAKKISGLDIDYDLDYVWYTRNAEATVYKADTNGIVLVSFERATNKITNDLGCIAVLSNDSGVWFCNEGKTLTFIDAQGTSVLDSITLSIDANINIMTIDSETSSKMWLYWGTTLGLLNLSGERKGEFDFTYTISNVISIDPVNSGCWVKTLNSNTATDCSYKFISKINHKVDSAVTMTTASKPFGKEIDYTMIDYTNLMPSLPSNTWTTLSWKKVNLNNYVFNEDTYSQIRVTLRSKDASALYPGESSFITSDSFDQTSATPRNVLWSDWTDKTTGDGLSKVYVDTALGSLVLNSILGSPMPYITTKNRVMLVPSHDIPFDIRIYYKIGDGNVYPSGTGKEERVYLYIYGVHPGESLASVPYLGAELVINSTGTSQNIYLYYRLDSGSSNTQVKQFTSYTNMCYEGVLRISSYGDPAALPSYSNYIVFNPAFWANNSWRGFSGTDGLSISDYYGTRFYIQIWGSSSGSGIKISKFETVSGIYGFYTASPEVDVIYAKAPVILNDVPSNGSKNAYIRTQVSPNLNIANSIDMNLKTRWEVPVF